MQRMRTIPVADFILASRAVVTDVAWLNPFLYIIWALFSVLASTSTNPSSLLTQRKSQCLNASPVSSIQGVLTHTGGYVPELAVQTENRVNRQQFSKLIHINSLDRGNATL